MFLSAQDTLKVLNMTAREFLQAASEAQFADTLNEIVFKARSAMESRKKKGDLLSNPDALTDLDESLGCPIKFRVDRHGNRIFMLQ